MSKAALLFILGKASMKRLLACLFSALLLSCCLSASAAEESPQLVVPGDDLPYAVTGGYRIDFTRNGAFVVSRDGHYLFDGGLVYTSPDWKEWGTQIRKSDDVDSWQTDPLENAPKLQVHGTLFDFNRNARFTFAESAEVIPGGLRLSYGITPLEKRQIGAFGVTLHFPVAETADARAVFSPGLDSVAMPKDLEGATIYSGTARAATVAVAAKPRVMVAGSGSIGWRLLDYRTWGVNAYWLVGMDSALRQPLSRGETASFTFDVWLGDAAAHRIALGPAWCVADPYGGIAIEAGGERIAAGGLAGEGEQLKWIHATARAEVPGGDADAEASGQSGSTQGPLGYDVKLAREPDNAVLVTYKMHRLDDAKGDCRARLTLAIPMPKAPSSPPEHSTGVEGGVPASGGSAAPAAQRVLQVVCRDGRVLTVEAADALSTSRAQVNGTDCSLASVPIRSPEGDGATVWVRLKLTERPAVAGGGTGK